MRDTNIKQKIQKLNKAVELLKVREERRWMIQRILLLREWQKSLLATC